MSTLEFENLEAFIRKKFGSQAALAQKLKIRQASVSAWVTGRAIPSPDTEKALRKLGYDGPIPTGPWRVAEPAATYHIQGIEKENIEVAWVLLHRVATEEGINLLVLDPELVGNALGVIAREVSLAGGNREEVLARMQAEAKKQLRPLAHSLRR